MPTLYSLRQVPGGQLRQRYLEPRRKGVAVPSGSGIFKNRNTDRCQFVGAGSDF